MFSLLKLRGVVSLLLFAIANCAVPDNSKLCDVRVSYPVGKEYVSHDYQISEYFVSAVVNIEGALEVVRPVGGKRLVITLLGDKESILISCQEESTVYRSPFFENPKVKGANLKKLLNQLSEQCGKSENSNDELAFLFDLIFMTSGYSEFFSKFWVNPLRNFSEDAQAGSTDKLEERIRAIPFLTLISTLSLLGLEGLRFSLDIKDDENASCPRPILFSASENDSTPVCPNPVEEYNKYIGVIGNITVHLDSGKEGLLSLLKKQFGIQNGIHEDIQPVLNSFLKFVIQYVHDSEFASFTVSDCEKESEYFSADGLIAKTLGELSSLELYTGVSSGVSKLIAARDVPGFLNDLDSYIEKSKLKFDFLGLNIFNDSKMVEVNVEPSSLDVVHTVHFKKNTNLKRSIGKLCIIVDDVRFGCCNNVVDFIYRHSIGSVEFIGNDWEGILVSPKLDFDRPLRDNDRVSALWLARYCFHKSKRKRRCLVLKLSEISSEDIKEENIRKLVKMNNNKGPRARYSLKLTTKKCQRQEKNAGRFTWIIGDATINEFKKRAYLIGGPCGLMWWMVGVADAGIKNIDVHVTSSDKDAARKLKGVMKYKVAKFNIKNKLEIQLNLKIKIVSLKSSRSNQITDPNLEESSMSE